MTPLPGPLAAILRHDPADPGWQDRDRLMVARDLPDGRLALGLAAGLAYAERLMAQRHGRSLVDHRVWLFAEPADLACGAALEAAAAAAALRLERLAVILSCAEPEAALLSQFAAAGWAIRRVTQDGDLASAVSASQRSRRPTLIACPARLVAAGVASASDVVPQDTARGGATARRVWLKRLARHGGRCEFERVVGARLPPRWHDALTDPCQAVPAGQRHAGTEPTLRAVLTRVAGKLGELCLLTAECGWQGRVQAMGSVLCGMAQHGGLLPVGIASLGDLDSLLPPVRLAAEQGLRLVLLLSEPTSRNRSTGRRAALRAIPNLLLLRPADAFEAIECMELALRRTTGPSVLLVSEVQVKLLSERPSRTHAARGGYLIRGAGLPRDVTLLASGQEIAVALLAADTLAGEGIVAAVASLPCWTLFAQQDPCWRDLVLGRAPIAAIERGSGFGWANWIGPGGLFIDPDEPGSSPAQAIRRFLQKPQNPTLLLEKARDAG